MILYYVGNAIIGLGVLFIFIGLYGFYKVKDFKSKLLVAATVDTTAMITILIGAMIRSGFSWMTLKLILLLAVILLIAPISTSKIALGEKINSDRDQNYEITDSKRGL